MFAVIAHADTFSHIHPDLLVAIVAIAVGTFVHVTRAKKV